MSATIDEKTHRIEGTRTSVYHILDYTTMNYPAEEIVKYLPITVEQVHAAVRFIEEHKAEVMAEYQKMLDRCARGNSPEIEALVARSHEKLLKMREELKARAQNCC